MIITLANGRKVEIKAIDLAHGRVDYRRIDDPVYGGDCVLYHPFTSEETVNAEITAALNASEAEREASQTAADLAREQERLAAVAVAAAKAQSITDNLPSWTQVSTAVDSISNLAEAKVFLKRLSRVVYWLARDKEE